MKTSLQESGKDDDFQEAQDSPNDVQEETSSPEPPKSKDSKLIAIIAMNVAALTCTATTAVFRVLAEEGFHPAEFNLLRNIMPLILACIWCFTLSYNPLQMFPWEQKGTMLTRCISGQGNFLLLAVAAPLAPLALIMVFWQTSTFWISIVAFLLLKEPIIALEMLSMIICFGAVVVIATQQREENLGNELPDGDIQDSSNMIGLICALISGVIAAFYAVSSRVLKEIPLPIVIFYYTVGGLLMTGAFIGIECAITGNGSRLTQYSGRQFLICLGACVLDSISLFAATLAYQKDSSGFVALISYMIIVYAYICDQIFFNEHLNQIELVAVLVILIVALGTAVYKLRQQALARKIEDEIALAVELECKRDGNETPLLRQLEQ